MGLALNRGPDAEVQPGSGAPEIVGALAPWYAGPPAPHHPDGQPRLQESAVRQPAALPPDVSLGPRGQG